MPVDWVTFDCYGTLIDWERGITDALLPLLPPRTDRRALAEWYIAMEAQFEKEGYHLYRDVLDRVGRLVLRSLDAPIPDEMTSPLPSSLADWQPFPEAPRRAPCARRPGAIPRHPFERRQRSTRALDWPSWDPSRSHDHRRGFPELQAGPWALATVPRA